MRAGRMKYRLHVFKPETLANAFGEEQNRYTQVATIWAERVKLLGNFHTEAAEQFSDYQVVFNVRSEHHVLEGYRVQQLGGYLYNVDNVIPNLDRGMLTLQCSRINE